MTINILKLYNLNRYQNIVIQEIPDEENEQDNIVNKIEGTMKAVEIYFNAYKDTNKIRRVGK